MLSLGFVSPSGIGNRLFQSHRQIWS